MKRLKQLINLLRFGRVRGLIPTSKEHADNLRAIERMENDRVRINPTTTVSREYYEKHLKEMRAVDSEE